MLCEGKNILKSLRETYEINQEDFASLKVFNTTKDSFKLLVATILSQNTTDKSALKAYHNLESKIGVNPRNLANADVEEIRGLIRIAGLSKNKAKNIKEISNIILNKYKNLDNILSLEPEEAKKKLLELPGVGEKTADVVLVTAKGYRFFPVDTHIKRIATRLGLISSQKEKYGVISDTLMRIFNDSILEAHLLLISHGRKTCKPRNPLCNKCVIRHCCKFGSGKSPNSYTT